MQDTAGEVRTNLETTYSSGPQHIDEQKQDDQLEPIYNNSVLIQDITRKTSRERWPIEMGSVRGSERYVLAMMMMMMHPTILFPVVRIYPTLQPLTRTRYKFNFLAKFNKYEFIVYLFLVWLSCQS